MGLDMWLEKEIHVGAEYVHRNVTGKIKLKTNGTPIVVDISKVSSITERVCYWRKANAIHDWFVTNVQDGTDDCKRYYVPYMKTQELLKICLRILATDTFGDVDTTLAESLLPTKSGFFFGGTDYDEYYVEVLKETILALASIDEDDCVYYSSSW